MSSPSHSQQVATDGIHTPISYTYLTSASLVSSTGFTLYDTYKMAFVTGDNSLWLLINPLAVPPTWINIPATIATGSITNIVGEGGTTVGISDGQATISSSVPQVQSIAGVGGITVTQNGTQWIVSGSQGLVSQILGSGGTTVSNSGGDYTVSSSVGANLFGSFVEVGTDSINSQSRKIAQGSGITVTDNGPGGTLVIAATGIVSASIYADLWGSYITAAPSAELPNYFVATGQGGTAVSIGTKLLNISSSLVTVSGVGGTSVTDGGGTTYVVSSSQGVLSVVAQGAIAASIAGTVLTISGSGPAVETILGAGASTVTAAGNVFTVSSSQGVLSVVAQGAIGASIAGSVLTISGSGPAVESITGLGATTVAQTAGAYTVSSSAGVLSVIAQGGTAASIAGTALTVSSSLVTVAAGTGVTVTNGGGTTYTVSATGGGGSSGPPFLSASYTGYTGNLQWKNASYTLVGTDDFIAVNTSVSALTMSLPQATLHPGKWYIIKDVYGTAGTNPFCVAPNGSDTIDGLSGSLNSYANFGAVKLLSAGPGWWTF